MAFIPTPETPRKTVVEVFAPLQLVLTTPGGEDLVRIGLVINDFEISDPFLSECGRFPVDPLDAYGLTGEQSEGLIQINALLDIVQCADPVLARNIAQQKLGVQSDDAVPGGNEDFVLHLIQAKQARMPVR